MRSRWLGTKGRDGATNFCYGAAIIVDHNSISKGVGRARLGYGSQNTFNARFLFRRRRALVILWRDCLQDCLGATLRTRELTGWTEGKYSRAVPIFLFNLHARFYLNNGVRMSTPPRPFTELER